MKKIKLVCEIFFVFFRISLFSIGGGAVMIPLVIDAVVEKKKWMSKEEIIDTVAISQTVPGAIIVNNSIFIGRTVAGLPGAIAAFFGVAIPSFVCIVIIMQFLDKIVDNSHVIGFFKGALAAAAALVAVSCYKIGKNIIKNITDLVLALISFVLIVFFNVSIILVILTGAIAGLIIYYSRLFLKKRKDA